MAARANPAPCAVDLRDCNMTAEEAERLAEVLRCCPKLISVDVRGNEQIGEGAASRLVDPEATHAAEEEARGLEEMRKAARAALLETEAFFDGMTMTLAAEEVAQA